MLQVPRDELAQDHIVERVEHEDQIARLWQVELGGVDTAEKDIGCTSGPELRQVVIGDDIQFFRQLHADNFTEWLAHVRVETGLAFSRPEIDEVVESRARPLGLGKQLAQIPAPAAW
ncbi:hypothetical protein AWV80_10195 [Cupriavidus sp. UYMU48A]|nr:hypothetical protein AWV80_10195 [Cupriavidus sp. UYMU48A]